MALDVSISDSSASASLGLSFPTIIEYRHRGLLYLRGASDVEEPAATNLEQTIRTKIISGALPLSAEPPAKSWVGKGTSRACDGCDRVIVPDQIEYELDLADGRKLRLHADCLAAWHAARAEQLTQRPAANSTASSMLAGFRIVVVDDHADSRDLLQEAFTFLGAEVMGAATAEEGLRHIGDADVVITDFALPGKNGAWLLEQINASARPIPVVLVSGYTETQTPAVAAAPFALKLLKPIDVWEVARVIREKLTWR